MKVLHVINGLSVGGSENLMVSHVARLVADFPSCINRIVVLGSRANAHERYLRRLPEEPTFLGFAGNYRDPVASARCIGGIRRAIEMFRPDIVHSYLWLADVLTAIAVRGTAVGHVSHALDRRGDRGAARALTRWRTRLTGALLRGSEARFAAVSEACRSHLMRHYLIAPETAITAYNGIDLEAFSPVGERPFSRAPAVFGTISRLAEEKGHKYLIEAFAMLQGTASRLQIAGTGANADCLRAEVMRRGLGDRISFLGDVPSAADFYQSIDVFVVPSIEAEGLPTTILEAMASGLPVVATDIGGAAEAIEDGVHGLIVPPRDPAALAGAMEGLIRDPERARAFGVAARARVAERFTAEAMTRTIMEKLYRPALESRQKLAAA